VSTTLNEPTIIVCFLLGYSSASEFYHILHSTRTYLPMKMEQTECSETSVYKIQTPGNHQNESVQHSGHGESLKSRTKNYTTFRFLWMAWHILYCCVRCGSTSASIGILSYLKFHNLQMAARIKTSYSCYNWMNIIAVI